MHISKERADAFAQARIEKQQVFQKCWNTFLHAPLLSAAILVLFVSQLLLLGYGPVWLRQIGFYIGILHEGYPAWCSFVMLGLAVCIAAPGLLSCYGLLRLKKEGMWSAETKPVFKGLALVKYCNLAVSAVLGAALILYPTIIIASGEILQPTYITRVFYLFLAATIVFLLSFCLLRPVLRRLEENISCCWADDSLVLCLIVTIPLVVAGFLFFAKLSLFSAWILVMLGASLDFLLILYNRFLRKTKTLLAEIDHKTLSKQENPDDPYDRY